VGGWVIRSGKLERNNSRALGPLAKDPRNQGAEEPRAKSQGAKEQRSKGAKDPRKKPKRFTTLHALHYKDTNKIKFCEYNSRGCIHNA
jgi:hypothetical protein